ncbi:MAG: hypothetical protein V1755_09300 [Chloroflexota bacterium]
MNRRNLVSIVALAILGTAGCSPVPGGMSQSAAALTSTAPVAVPTDFLWFPPTETPSVAAAVTREPTPERRPGIGGLMVADDMTSSTHWNAAVSGEASATVSERGLTVSAWPGQPPVVSLHRSAILDDMYMEITARPSLCRERDAYGLVFRAPNEVAYYRFVVICDGTAAAERFSLGTPRVLQPPTASSDVPVGAPGQVRLGVWALGSEFRFFLNDRYQFTVSDSNYKAGGLGVFAQAGGDTPALVTFSGLSIYRLVPADTAATQTP